jgi:hypothetical protein
MWRFRMTQHSLVTTELTIISHHQIMLESSDCVVSGGNLPKLIDHILQQEMEEVISFTRTSNIGLTLVVEGDNVLAPLTLPSSILPSISNRTQIR